MLVSAAPLTAADGTFEGTLAILFDITGRRRLEREVVRLERLRALEELSIGISHNLNNMLVSVLGPAQLLLRWSDDLRNVEEMLEDRELRAEAARIRERARGIRLEFRRDFKAPEWDIVRKAVAEPLSSLRDRVAEELLKRDSEEALVPIDRDPVPSKYADQVRRYYERLGTGR